jgi:hypothetical protein
VSERRGLLYGDVPKHNYDLIDLTSLNLDEFQAILPIFEAEFINYTTKWTLEGKPRHPDAPPYRPRKGSNLPAPEDRLLFILSYLKSGTTQFFHAYLFGMNQPQAYLWIRLLLHVLDATLQRMGHAPCRSAESLKEKITQRLDSQRYQPMPESDPSTPPLEAAIEHSASMISEVTTPALPEAAPSPVEQPKALFCHDATERPIARPLKGQARFYSGKKKGTASRTSS